MELRSSAALVAGASGHGAWRMLEEDEKEMGCDLPLCRLIQTTVYAALYRVLQARLQLSDLAI
jgi:hypothetical protein